MDDREEDRLLFERWMAGDPSGFTGIYEKYRKRIFGFLLKMTADRALSEDLMQETFFAAMRNASQFDPARSLLSWFFGIAHKKAIDHFRHVKVVQTHEAEGEKAMGSKIDLPDADSWNAFVRKAIAEAVETLEPAQREVFLMREVGGVAFKDIAVVMQCPLNTALGRMRLALKNIRKELEKRGINGV